MTENKPAKPTDAQIKAFTETYRPKPPAHYTEDEKSKFNKIAKRVTYKWLDDRGGYERDLSQLSDEETFAIGAMPVVAPYLSLQPQKIRDIYLRNSKRAHTALADDGSKINYSMQRTDGELEVTENMIDEMRRDALHVIHAASFAPGRVAGAKEEHTKHIEALVEKHPELTAKKLRKLADKNLVGQMADGTFANAVYRAKKALRAKNW